MFLFLAAAHVAAPEWRLTESVDPITDRTVAMATVDQGKGRLGIGCTIGSQGKIGVVAVFPRYLARTGEVAGVDVRFDTDPAYRVSALFNQAQVQIRPAKVAEEFVSKLRSARRVVLQTDSYEGQTYSVIFTLPESSAALDRVIAGCSGFADG